jgi:hypothetical protein
MFGTGARSLQSLFSFTDMEGKQNNAKNSLSWDFSLNIFYFAYKIRGRKMDCFEYGRYLVKMRGYF